MEMVLATRNVHKIRELRSIFSEVGVELKTLRDFGDFEDVEEDGRTFEENAIKKALVSARHCGIMALADDSGLEIKALGGRPGLYSSRYAETNDERIERVLREMREVGEEERDARFVCAMALADAGGRSIVKVGYCEGEIAYAPRGGGGFGYDPIFYLPDHGVTMAELASKEKNRISHRARAAQQLFPVLKKLIDKGGTLDEISIF
jgi:XTP/dITP diphosphohydrolase